MPPPAPPRSSEAQLAAQLRVALVRLARRLRSQPDEGLTPTMLSALAAIEAHGPVTLGELAAAEQVRPPTVTRVVGALDEQGLIVRTTDPDDRRVTRVELTEAGQALLAEARGRRDAELARLLAELSDDELAQLEDALPILQRLSGEEVSP